MSWYRTQLEDWLKTLDVKADTVYDIGGKQNPVKGRTKSWEVDNYEILDLPEWDLTTPDPYKFRNVKKADLVFCLEVFEYLVDPIRAISNLRKPLKTGGKAYATFAFVYPHHNELELDSLRYTETSIHRLADIVTLKVTNTWYRTDRSGLLTAFYSTDGMRMAKEYPRHDVTGFIVEFTR